MARAKVPAKRKPPAVAVPLTDGELPATKRAKYLKCLRDNPEIGNKTAFRRAGVRITKPEIEALFAADPDLEQEALEARGRNIQAVEQTIWEIAQDAAHPSALRAGVLLMGRYSDRGWLPARLDLRHEHSGPGGGPMEVSHPDLAAAIERFTTAVVRSTERARAELPAGEADAGAESQPRLHVARLDRSA